MTPTATRPFSFLRVKAKRPDILTPGMWVLLKTYLTAFEGDLGYSQAPLEVVRHGPESFSSQIP